MRLPDLDGILTLKIDGLCHIGLVEGRVTFEEDSMEFFGSGFDSVHLMSGLSMVGFLAVMSLTLALAGLSFAMRAARPQVHRPASTRRRFSPMMG